MDRRRLPWYLARRDDLLALARTDRQIVVINEEALNETAFSWQELPIRHLYYRVSPGTPDGAITRMRDLLGVGFFAPDGEALTRALALSPPTRDTPLVLTPQAAEQLAGHAGWPVVVRESELSLMSPDRPILLDLGRIAADGPTACGAASPQARLDALQGEARTRGLEVAGVRLDVTGVDITDEAEGERLGQWLAEAFETGGTLLVAGLTLADRGISRLPEDCVDFVDNLKKYTNGVDIDLEIGEGLFGEALLLGHYDGNVAVTDWPMCQPQNTGDAAPLLVNLSHPPAAADAAAARKIDEFRLLGDAPQAGDVLAMPVDAGAAQTGDARTCAYLKARAVCLLI